MPVKKTAPPVIREQITQMAPIPLSEMDSAPTNTDEDGPGELLRREPGERPPVQRRKRKQQPSENPLMDDPRYVKAIQGLNFYGAPRILKRGFNSTAEIMHKPELALTKDEESNIDDYFYALSKHTKFDPMATVIGRCVLLILLIGELVIVRYLKFSPLGQQLKKMLERKDDEPTEEIPDKEPPVM